MFVGWVRSVACIASAFLSQRIVIGDQTSGIPKSTQVFPRIKAERPRQPHQPGHSPVVSGQMALGAIFNHPQSTTLRDFQDARHVRRLTQQMHRQDAFRARRYFRFDQRRIDRVVVFLHIHKNRTRSALGNHLGGGNPTIGGRDDFITRPHPQHLQDDKNGIRSIGHAHAVLRAHSRSVFPFECLHKRTPNKGRFFNHRRYRGVDFRLERDVLGLEVKKRNFH